MNRYYSSIYSIAVIAVLAISSQAWCAYALKGGKGSFAPLGANVELVGGASFALGEFRDDDWPYKTSESGFAGPGIAGGLKLCLDFGTSGLGLVLDAGCAASSVDESDVEHAIIDQYSLSADADVEADADFWWVTVPILAGPKFSVQVMPGLAPYVTGLMGIAIVNQPDMRIQSSGLAGDYEYNAAPGFCIGTELGCVLGRFIAGMKFMIIPEVDIEAEEVFSINGYAGQPDLFETSKPVSIMQLLIGYQF